ncbi:Dihydrofolate reductase [Tenacibaculum sp. MAR_2009_124]|uniref:dihydrofolate reductase n=1 Tax=Tenacibaculum sp. MAR_2009_124 TaxID=1250059 RepID=UPI000899644A|nr:dihydrofolate reductase [Tenacibaculum sp. MAR_2009_124]SEC21943.1 Dihydrofolate reductase [Tenacibaculum sp. MAR_2009_124]
MGEKHVIDSALISLKKILHEFPQKALCITEEDWNVKKSSGKWSKKELLGHLVDSTFNNLQRYIRVQYEDTPHVMYNQNEWVRSQHWQKLPVTRILSLWEAVNWQILHVWEHFPKEKTNLLLDISKETKEIHTFAEMIEDYINHAKHHIKQILPQMITVIAAIGENNELGKGNDLIWHLPADLKRFKRLTSGHHIIMGRNTYESIGKPLPNRTTIIVTRDKNYQQEGCLTAGSIEEAVELAKSDDEIFIIGGAQIYKQVLAFEFIDKLDITHVHSSFEADVYFPEINSNQWKEVRREDFKADDKNKYDYSFVSYVRKSQREIQKTE